MKACPTCKRTYEDDLTFCLVDGSVLSAPFDARAAQGVPIRARASPPRTEILPREDPLASTLPAQPTTLYRPPSEKTSEERRVNAPATGALWALFKLVLAILSSTLWFTIILKFLGEDAIKSAYAGAAFGLLYVLLMVPLLVIISLTRTPRLASRFYGAISGIAVAAIVAGIISAINQSYQSSILLLSFTGAFLFGGPLALVFGILLWPSRNAPYPG